MSALGLTSVDLFVIAMGLVLGYLVVSHFLEPKRGAGGGGGATGSESGGTEEADWERVLGVSRYAPPEQVHEAYRTKIAMYHPDKVAALGDEFKVLANRKSKEINAAYVAACRDKGIN